MVKHSQIETSDFLQGQWFLGKGPLGNKALATHDQLLIKASPTHRLITMN